MTAPRLYDLRFFQVLIGASLTMIGVSLLYHFGEFVSHLGYGEAMLGWITGIGVCGSLLLRPWIGQWIDRVGCRRSFITAALTAAGAYSVFPFVESLPLIAGLRIVLVAAQATYLTTVAVFAAHAAVPERRAEALGTVGVGGFLGILTGPAIGDWIFARWPDPHDAFLRFFFSAAAASTLAALIVSNIVVERPEHDPLPERFWRLVRRHRPGLILLVSVAFAASLTIHMSFLERYAHFRGFENIRTFYFVYAPTAIVIRILGRRIPEIVGRRRLCIVGLSAVMAGVLLLIQVETETELILPAVLMGLGHAFVFPSMIDLAAESFPLAHRGVGTSIALGAGDIGMLSGNIVWGMVIESAGWRVAFMAVAGTLGATAVLYGWSQRTRLFSRNADVPASAAL